MKAEAKAQSIPGAAYLTKVTWLPIVSILLIATGLYFYQLGSESFWHDEFYSVYDALAIPDRIPLIRPLYYFLLRAWIMLGGDGNDVWLRSLSIPFALGSILLAYHLGNRLVGKSVGLITALLMTLSPLFVNHAQEVRMYTLIVFLSLAGTLAFTYVLEKLTIKSLFWWGIARILAIATNSSNILLLLPDCLLLVWKFRRRRRFMMGFAISMVVIAIVSLPWTINLYKGVLDFMGGWAAGDDKPTLINVISRLTIFTVYWPLKSLESSPSEHFYKLYTVMLLGVLGGCFIRKPIGDSNLKRQYNGIAIFCLAMWVILPGLGMFAISWLLSPVWVPRYLLFFAPYVLILLAMGFVKIYHWQPKLAIFIALVYAVAVIGGLNDYYTKVYRPDWRGAAQMISQQEKDSDVIAFYFNADRPLEFMLSRYYSGNLPINLLTINKDNGQADLPSFPERLWLVHKDNQHISDEFLEQVQNQYKVQEAKFFKNETGWEITVNVFLLTHKN